MAEKYGARPSDLLNGSLGDLATDCDVFSAAMGVEGDMAMAAEQDPKNGRRLVFLKLQRDAEAERKYEERHGS